MIIERIKETTPGTWSVQEDGQKVVCGAIILQRDSYSYILRCEKDGEGPCRHIEAVQILLGGAAK